MLNMLATSLVAAALALSPVIAFAATSDMSGPVTSEAQATQILQSKGYSDITGLQKQGDNFVATSAEMNGKTMQNVEVNGKTGEVTPAQ